MTNPRSSIFWRIYATMAVVLLLHLLPHHSEAAAAAGNSDTVAAGKDLQQRSLLSSELRRLQDVIHRSLPSSQHLTNAKSIEQGGGVSASPLHFASMISIKSSTKSGGLPGGLRASETETETPSCDAETKELANCIFNDSDNDFAGCTSCIDEFFPLGIVCSTIDRMCPAANKCSDCGNCAEELTKFFSCRFDCGSDVDCSNPTSLACPDEAQAISKCFDSTEDKNSCVDCIIKTWNTPVEFCSDIDPCNAVSECASSCGDCGPDQVVEYFACLEPSCCFKCSDNYVDCILGGGSTDPDPVDPVDPVDPDPVDPDPVDPVDPERENGGEPAGAAVESVDYACPDDLNEDPLTFGQSGGKAFSIKAGDTLAVGDRMLWSKVNVLNSNGEVVGYSFGMCTLLANEYNLCNQHFKFNGGSTLDMNGIMTRGEDAITEYTITGGSGCFAGASGTLAEIFLDDGAIETVVTIEG